MKQIALTITLLILMISCDNSARQNEINRSEMDVAQTKAELSSENISELPLNFEFGMTRDEVNKHLEKLVKKGVISKKGDKYYDYDYILESGQKIGTSIETSFYEDRLYDLYFSLYGLKFDYELIAAIDKEITNKVDSTYKRISYYMLDYDDSKMWIIKWFKENQYIYLRNAAGTDIHFVNAPIERIADEKRNQKLLERARMKAGIEVKNSSLDGSVSQVVKYLKNNLKDPDSYESIEWGNVTETDNGYIVRHKYRAKNSFGGYVIEHQIFHIDWQGNITSVSPF
ncbi:MAG: hypothetical protein IJE43_12170 [Alphaproteobacteria bacterium]|nr:hypothetical protein [Alphaproteobacteria bacterium]